VSYNLKKALENLRQEFSACMRETHPSKELRAKLLMAMVGLHLIEARIRKTRILEERRCLINEFNQGRKAIEKGIYLLRKSGRRGSEESEERRRRAVP